MTPDLSIILSKKGAQSIEGQTLSNILDPSFYGKKEGFTDLDRQKLKVIRETVSQYRIEKATRQPITSTRTAMDVFREMIGYEKQEHVVLLTLDTKNHIISRKVIFKGSLNSSVAHPREIFKQAVEDSAARIMIGHNHPSGDVQPSQEDMHFTRRLRDAGEMMGIPLLDHIIVSDCDEYSFREAECILV